MRASARKSRPETAKAATPPRESVMKRAPVQLLLAGPAGDEAGGAGGKREDISGLDDGRPDKGSALYPVFRNSSRMIFLRVFASTVARFFS